MKGRQVSFCPLSTHKLHEKHGPGVIPAGTESDSESVFHQQIRNSFRSCSASGFAYDVDGESAYFLFQVYYFQ